MFNFISKIGITLGLGIASLFGFHQNIQQSTPALGAATTPISTAFYSDSLQSGINQTATSFTLVKGQDAQGNNLSGVYGFVIDQGSPSQEIVYCTNVSGVNVSGCSRGIDLTTGTSTVIALEQTHNRGATVQITTAPIVNILTNILRGTESISAPLFYYSHPCSVSSGTTTICDKNYIDNIVTAGAPNANETTNGISQIATALQAASSTSIGSTGARLVIPSSLSTSTPGSNASLVNVISLNDGKISPAFLNGTGENYSLNGVTSIANAQIASTTIATSTQYIENVGTINATSSIAVNGVSVATLNTKLPNTQYSLASSSQINIGQNQSVSTASVGVPANTLTGSTTITFDGDLQCTNPGSSTLGCTLLLTDQNSDTFFTALYNSSTNSQTCNFPFHAVMIATTTTSELTTVYGWNNCGSSGAYTLTQSKYSQVNLTNALSFLINVTTPNSSGNSAILKNVDITIRP